MSSADCVHPCSITTSARDAPRRGNDAGVNSTKARDPSALVYTARVLES